MVIVAENTLKHFRTTKNFVRRLAESFRNQMFSELATNPEVLGKIQIRLDSS
jgi:Flp pilus assembly CpaE family ATPase